MPPRPIVHSKAVVNKPANPYQSRLEALQRLVQEEGLAGLILNPGPTLHYLTGLDFHLMERPVLLVVPAEGALRMMLPELERLKLDESPFPIAHETYGEDPQTWPAAAAQILGGSSGPFGAETRGLRFLEMDLLQQADSRIRLQPADELVSRVRGRKDAAEVEIMRRAVRIAEAAVEATVMDMREGMTERELADELVLNLLRRGSSLDLPFAPIVSFGENSANPHASPSDRALRPGDLVLIDWGARRDGYASDLTRVYAWGDVPEELRKIAAIVEEANLAAQAAAAPGVPAGAVDRAARDVISRAGYGDRFVHRTGHGLGLEAHEEPYIRGDNEQPLEAGHAFTIEPGIYVPELGGVRIEDDVVVTERGIDVLSKLPRALTQLG